jgi:toxin ParE1/3/4
MRYEFHPEARLEFLESAAFYQGCRPGLGVAFANEIESVLRLIIEAPDRFPFIGEDVRRCLARRFPYGILYAIETDYILIIAVMHCSRKPGYWRNRLPERSA